MGFGFTFPAGTQSALQKTGSNYQLGSGQPYAGNPVDLRNDVDFQNDVRRKQAFEQFGTPQEMSDGTKLGGKQGGGFMGMMGGMMGGGGGKGGGGGGGGQGPVTQLASGPGETQAQMIERQFSNRRAAEQQRVQNLASIAGKMFGF